MERNGDVAWLVLVGAGSIIACRLQISPVAVSQQSFMILPTPGWINARLPSLDEAKLVDRGGDRSFGDAEEAGFAMGEVLGVAASNLPWSSSIRPSRSKLISTCVWYFDSTASNSDACRSLVSCKSRCSSPSWLSFRASLFSNSFKRAFNASKCDVRDSNCRRISRKIPGKVTNVYLTQKISFLCFALTV